MSTKNLKKNAKSQKGGSLVCPSDLESPTTNVAHILNAFALSLNSATDPAGVVAAFKKLTDASTELESSASASELTTAIIAMPEAFSKRLTDPKYQAALKNILGDSGNVSELLRESAAEKFNEFVALVPAEVVASTPAAAGAGGLDMIAAAAAVGGSINLQGGAKKKSTKSTKSTKKSTTKNSTTKKSSKKPSKKLVGGAKKNQRLW